MARPHWGSFGMGHACVRVWGLRCSTTRRQARGCQLLETALPPPSGPNLRGEPPARGPGRSRPAPSVSLCPTPRPRPSVSPPACRHSPAAPCIGPPSGIPVHRSPSPSSPPSSALRCVRPLPHSPVRQSVPVRPPAPVRLPHVWPPAPSDRRPSALPSQCAGRRAAVACDDVIWVARPRLVAAASPDRERTGAREGRGARWPRPLALGAGGGPGRGHVTRGPAARLISCAAS